MELVQLSRENVDMLKNKEICCVGKSMPYLDELCAAYDLWQRIQCFVDTDLRNCGRFVYRGKQMTVYPPEYMESLDLSKTVLLIMSDYYREYYDKVTEVCGYRHETVRVYFFAGAETEYELFYRKRYEKEPLRNMIVFRSGPHADAYVKGMDFSDNARALFEYMLRTRVNEIYELIWIVKTPDMFQAYQKYENVSFLPYSASVSEEKELRDRYYRVLCLARYFFFTDAYGFVRNCRKDQIRVQLWHGCGYKKRLNPVSCEKRYDFMTVTSRLYAELHAGEFGLRKNQMLVTGNAKTDWLFQDSAQIMRILPLPAARKYIFWMPTYRFSRKEMNKPVDGKLKEETGLPLLSSAGELARVNAVLAESDIALVIKLHPFQDRGAVLTEGFDRIAVLENEFLAERDIQINQVLCAADALISDYSSVAVDYLALNRPMAFIIEDLDEYKDRRGFIFDPVEAWLPGMLISSVEQMLLFIDEIARDMDSCRNKRETILKKFYDHADGGNCGRIMRALEIYEK